MDENDTHGGIRLVNTSYNSTDGGTITIPFTLSGTFDRVAIRFSGYDTHNGSAASIDLDDVLLTVEEKIIPEPSTYLVFAGLALCFGAAGWWRKRCKAAA